MFLVVVVSLRFYPPYTNGFLVYATFFFFFFSLIIAWNGFWQFFLFSPIFGLKKPDFIKKKKVFFCLVVRGVYPPYSYTNGFVVPATFFMCVFPNISKNIVSLRFTCFYKEVDIVLPIGRRYIGKIIRFKILGSDFQNKETKIFVIR